MTTKYSSKRLEAKKAKKRASLDFNANHLTYKDRLEIRKAMRIVKQIELGNDPKGTITCTTAKELRDAIFNA